MVFMILIHPKIDDLDANNYDNDDIHYIDK